MVLFKKKDNFRDGLSSFVFENSPDAYCVIENGHITAFNTAFPHLMNQPAAELYDLTPPEISTEYQQDGRRSDVAAMEYIEAAMSNGHCR